MVNDTFWWIASAAVKTDRDEEREKKKLAKHVTMS